MLSFDLKENCFFPYRESIGVEEELNERHHEQSTDTNTRSCKPRGQTAAALEVHVDQDKGWTVQQASGDAWLSGKLVENHGFVQKRRLIIMPDKVVPNSFYRYLCLFCTVCLVILRKVIGFETTRRFT